MHILLVYMHPRVELACIHHLWVCQCTVSCSHDLQHVMMWLDNNPHAIAVFCNLDYDDIEHQAVCSYKGTAESIKQETLVD